MFVLCSGTLVCDIFKAEKHFCLLGHFSPFSTYLRSMFKILHIGTKNYVEEFRNLVLPDSNKLLKLSKTLFFLRKQKTAN